MYFFGLGLMVFVTADIVAYLIALRGHGVGSWFVITLILNVLFLIVVLTKKRESVRSNPATEAKRKFSWRAKLFGGAVVVACAVNVMLTGQARVPLIDNNGYYAKTVSGEHIEISRDEYDRLIAMQTRLFSGTWIAINLALASSLLTREKY
jgi:hypothetical protein